MRSSGRRSDPYPGLAGSGRSTHRECPRVAVIEPLPLSQAWDAALEDKHDQMSSGEFQGPYVMPQTVRL